MKKEQNRYPYEHPIDPESCRDLWFSVITLAIKDAKKGRIDAMNFLSSPELDDVATLGGLDKDYLSRKIKEETAEAFSDVMLAKELGVKYTSFRLHCERLGRQKAINMLRRRKSCQNISRLASSSAVVAAE